MRVCVVFCWRGSIGMETACIAPFVSLRPEIGVEIEAQCVFLASLRIYEEILMPTLQRLTNYTTIRTGDVKGDVYVD